MCAFGFLVALVGFLIAYMNHARFPDDSLPLLAFVTVLLGIVIGVAGLLRILVVEVREKKKEK
jgi:heme/copper-type cytochrome/quinol oxidase subunit 2